MPRWLAAILTILAGLSLAVVGTGAVLVGVMAMAPADITLVPIAGGAVVLGLGVALVARGIRRWRFAGRFAGPS